MCFLVDDDDGNDGAGGKSGKAKVQLGRHRRWLVPRRVLMVIFAVALIFCIAGIIFMAIGGGIGNRGLNATGGILFGLGLIGAIVCFLVCLFAYFVYGTRDQSVQTETAWTDEYQTDASGYASIGRPSALKSADSTLKRNGIAGQKKVTMAPEVGPYGESPPNIYQGGTLDARSRQQQLPKSPSFGSGIVYLGEGLDPRGVGGRNVGGTEVGTGGIRITTLDRNQPLPSPGSQVVYGGSGQTYAASGTGQGGYPAGPGHVIYSGGGSSASSSVDANYAYPKSVSAISGQESGFSDSGSQYSTLRSIPVTHIVHDGQRQQQENLEYARINKQAKNVHTLAADVQPPRGYSLPGHGYPQGQVNQFEQRFPVADDFDYDNPVERTPMISPKPQSPYGHSYHEQQMQYQRQQHQEAHASRQQHQDLHAPRQLNMQSLQRQTASNPYQYQQQQQQLQQHEQQQQQQMHYSSSSSSSHKVIDDDLPDLQPLVYPSARRPMTFEQVSSSKMSVYDNVLAGLKDDE